MSRLLVVGNPGKHHLGAHFVRAAQEMGIEATLCDTNRAYDAPRLVQRVAWHLLGHRPARMGAFGKMVLQACADFRPTWLLATGIVPLEARVLEQVGQAGIQRINFLTDDPWNPAQRADWFLQSLRHYDRLYTPRHANIADLQNVKRVMEISSPPASVAYLPFGYAPYLHYRPADVPSEDSPKVLFVGGADTDRVPMMAEAIALGLRPTLVGGYWERHAATRPYTHGHVDADDLRTLTAGAVNICLVRRANRDGHVMRSFEIPACGGCLVAEDTAEHRALFGAEGEAVLYFASVAELVAKTRRVVEEGAFRRTLAQRGYDLVHTAAHTYRHRLETMLDLV